MKSYKPMTPEEIVEYTHDEFTPYSRMGYEEGKKHLVDLIYMYVKWAIENNQVPIISLREDEKTSIA